MIKTPSQQFEYTLIFSGDPALALPAEAAEREKALEIARETGKWEPWLLGGEAPTLFRVRPLIGSVLDWFAGEVQRRSLSGAESAVLALRLALREIIGFGEQRVRFVREDGHQLVAMEVIDALYAIEGIGREVVQELGSVVLSRALEGLRPKS